MQRNHIPKIFIVGRNGRPCCCVHENLMKLMESLVDEVESMGVTELRKLEYRLTVLLMHLLKWKYQPHFRTRSWILAIREQRRRIVKRLQQSPSLKSKLNDVIADAYDLARGDAADETGLPEPDFPIKCPWKYSQIADMEFWPE